MPANGTRSRFQPVGTLTRPIQMRLGEEDCEYLAVRSAEMGVTMTDFVRYLIRLHRDGKVTEIAQTIREADAEQLFNNPDFYNGIGTKIYTMEEIKKLREENNEE